MRIPADWEPHQRCWIGIPDVPELWQERFLAARQTVIDLANLIIDFEPVNLLCPPGQGRFLRSYTDSRIEIIEASYNENWIREIAPVYVETGKGQVQALFSNNHNLPSYKIIRRLMCSRINIASTTIHGAIENGSITVDGQGMAICIAQGLFGNKRNDQDIIKKYLVRELGIKRIIMLTRPLINDHALGHVTNLVRFIHPGIVLLANHGNKNDPNKAVCLDTYDQLQEHNSKRINPRKLSIYQVQNPPPISYKGVRLNASYTNFYIANRAVFIPGFYKPKYDKNAFELFRELFPGYQIIQHQILPLLTGGGGMCHVTCPQLLGAKSLQAHIREFKYSRNLKQDTKFA